MAARQGEGPNPASTVLSRAETQSNEPVTLFAMDRLLSQVARGDSDAFAAVYDQVAGTVYSLVLRIVGDPARSQQVTGDVLTEVWRTASRFSPADGSGMSWIVAIAQRHAVGDVRAKRAEGGRKRARRPQLTQVVQEVSERAGLNRPGAPGAGRLASLPEPQRQALLLACYGGYTQAQVARLLKVPARTVAAWIRDSLPLLSTAAR
jgi:RNA polymerase sigma-70 factor, ECF subfamily